MERAALEPTKAEPGAPANGAPGSGFRLLRCFTLTTLVAFVTVGLALYWLQEQEQTFFAQVQREQAEFLSQAQVELARQQEEAARASLLAVHEAGHVNLTRLVANLLWESDFGPFVAAAQQVNVQACRAQAAEAGADLSSAIARRACFAGLGEAIKALPGYLELNTKAYNAMRASMVFKVKVFDLRGLTVYSSEPDQIGEDGSTNQGWRTAAAGRAASELTHRNRFSAFEGVVENRDLISTYVPVRAQAGGAVVGVFEIYSDVTPFLDQIKAASAEFAVIRAANEAKVDGIARANQRQVRSSSYRFLAIVGSLLTLLFLATLLVVRFGQRIIDKQALAQAQAAQREQIWHREKMVALATMAAGVSHEVGNRLAVITGLAEGMAQAGDAAVDAQSRLILEQTAQIAAMMRRIADFASARSRTPDWVDINAMVQAVCDFLRFDTRFRAAPIAFEPGPGLPARFLVPDHLNEVLMSLLQACVDAFRPGGTAQSIVVQTEARADGIVIRLSCCTAGAAPSPALARAGADARFESARRRVLELGGRLTTAAGGVEVLLASQGGGSGLGPPA